MQPRCSLVLFAAVDVGNGLETRSNYPRSRGVARSFSGAESGVIRLGWQHLLVLPRDVALQQLQPWGLSGRGTLLRASFHAAQFGAFPGCAGITGRVRGSRRVAGDPAQLQGVKQAAAGIWGRHRMRGQRGQQEWCPHGAVVEDQLSFRMMWLCWCSMRHYKVQV